MKQKTRTYSEEDIRKEFTIIADQEFRELAYKLKLPDCMYGTVVPEKEFFINTHK